MLYSIITSILQGTPASHDKDKTVSFQLKIELENLNEEGALLYPDCEYVDDKPLIHFLILNDFLLTADTLIDKGASLSIKNGDQKNILQILLENESYNKIVKIFKIFDDEHIKVLIDDLPEGTLNHFFRTKPTVKQQNSYYSIAQWLIRHPKTRQVDPFAMLAFHDTPNPVVFSIHQRMKPGQACCFCVLGQQLAEKTAILRTLR